MKLVIIDIKLCQGEVLNRLSHGQRSRLSLKARPPKTIGLVKSSIIHLLSHSAAFYIEERKS